MTFTLDNRFQDKESSLTQALRQIQQLNSRIQELEQHHQDYVRSQQNLISAIAEICISPIQEVQALRILIYRGEAACQQYLRSLLVKQCKSPPPISTRRSISTAVLMYNLCCCSICSSCSGVALSRSTKII
ncbi:hypothetical protein [uncultured Nostoc sp.]|uniref:hypothetical protein n=1 Tax=uncultured Nostoc sp. TaxID=340711 RepID=UPI0035CB0CEA